MRPAQPGGLTPAPAPPSSSPSSWIWPLLLLSTLLAYAPAWFGGPLWDDDRHMTAPALQSLDGLWRIWFEVGATQQYYPLVHSVFWIQHRLWGDHTLG